MTDEKRILHITYITGLLQDRTDEITSRLNFLCDLIGRHPGSILSTSKLESIAQDLIGHSQRCERLAAEILTLKGN